VVFLVQSACVVSATGLKLIQENVRSTNLCSYFYGTNMTEYIITHKKINVYVKLPSLRRKITFIRQWNTGLVRHDTTYMCT